MQSVGVDVHTVHTLMNGSYLTMVSIGELFLIAAAVANQGRHPLLGHAKKSQGRGIIFATEYTNEQSTGTDSPVLKEHYE